MREWSLEDIKEIIHLFTQTNLAELVLENGTIKLVLKRSNNITTNISTSVSSSVVEKKIEEVEDGHYISAPLVGVFYRAPAPGAPPFVNEGDLVEVGQTLCIIEAMKLMNEIKSDIRGRVKKILVENGQAVEYGQKLFIIEPE
ncbi:MAG: acetyl-CoA carboxylase biotin carboxyl carrier protein [Dictyoglomus sp.]|nr:acetyl-CoA carboxylase biotin carboxyl carrier protein [Dictyoglomus sp.]MCX7941795.1 acetyl-CoA carboxylase biotin carboxyl carrier protein [Dictyoglomaceae bacterium]MDW8188103.1 acetyl-CoA carboxylase biotin carboxyl carrier protein [Dictyoglomus sp.]